MSYINSNRYDTTRSRTQHDTKITSRTIQNGTARKVAILDKRQKICRDTRSRPLWELRTLQINPTDDQESGVFPSNSLHTGPLRLSLLIIKLLSNTLLTRFYTLIHILFFILEYILWYTVDGVYFSICPYVPLLLSIFISLFYGIVEITNIYGLGKLIDMQSCQIVDPRRPRLKTVKWSDLMLGNIVKLTSGDESPADIVPISTSGSNGMFCVDTSLVDGSGDLKIKSCVKDAGIEASLHAICRIRGQIVCNKPNASSEFNGTLKLRGFPRSNVLNTNNFIQRGSIVRNVSSVYGVVVYTGKDTKFGINSQGNILFKFTSIDRDANIYTMCLLLIFTICWITSIIFHHSSSMVSNQTATNTLKFTKVLKFASLYLSLVPNTIGAIFDINRLLQCARMKYKSISTSLIGSNIPDIVPLEGNRNEELGRIDFVFTGDRGVLTKQKPEIAFIHICDNLYSGENQRSLNTCNVTANGVLEPISVPLRPITHFNKTMRSTESKGKSRKIDCFLKLCSMCNISTTAIGGSRTFGSSPFSTSKSFKLPPRNSGVLSKSKMAVKNRTTSTSELAHGYRVGTSAIRSCTRSYSRFGTFKSLPSRARHFTSTIKSYSSRLMIEYMSLYPEDDCLVNLAFDRGYKLLYKSSTAIAILVRGKIQCWRILGIHPPSPQRNRMTLVLVPIRRSDWEKRGFKPLFSYRIDKRHERLAKSGKGALVLSRFNLSTNYSSCNNMKNPLIEPINVNEKDVLDTDRVFDLPSDPAIDRIIDNIINRSDYASFGGLCKIQLYYRWLTTSELEEYLTKKAEGSSTVFGSDEEDVSTLECKLQFVATIGFRDVLVNGVIETMENLTGAGVRICLSSNETAERTIGIAYYTTLLRIGARIFNATIPQVTENIENAEEDHDRTIRTLSSQLLDSFYRTRGECWSVGSQRSPGGDLSEPSHKQLCLIISGKDVDSFSNHRYLETCLANMLCFSDVIIAHEMEPQQKGKLVKLLKNRLSPTPSVLAIGYSYHDLCACRAADVSVALARRDCPISGIQQIGGNKLVCWSDYIVGGFSSLCDLLFFHGSTSLLSASLILSHLIFFSLCHGTLCFYYQAFTGWTALPVYPHTLIHVLTSSLAAWAAIHVTFIRRIAPRELLKNVPLLYTLGRRRYYLNGQRFCLWAVEAIVAASEIFFTIKVALDDSPYIVASGVGLSLSSPAHSALLSIAVLIMGTFRMAIQCNAWLLHSYGIVIGSVSIFAIFSPAILMLVSLLFFYFMPPSITLGAISQQILLWPYTWILIPLWCAMSLVGCEIFGIFGKRICGDVLDKFHSRVALLLRNATRQLRRSGAVGAETIGPNKLGKNKLFLWARPQIWTLTSQIIKEVANNFISPDNDIISSLPSPRGYVVREGPDVSKHDDDTLLMGNADHVPTSHLLNRLTLWFKDPQLEAEYGASRKTEYLSSIRWYRCVFSVFFIFYIANWIVEHQVAKSWSINSDHDDIDILLTLVPLILVSLALGAGFSATFYQVAFTKHSKLVLASVVIAVILHDIGADTFCAQEFRDSSWFHSVLFPIFTFVILRLPFLGALVSNLIFMLANIISGQVVPRDVTSTNLTMWSQEMPLYVGINLLVVLVGYRLEYNARKSFILEYAAACARRRQREILNTMLPHFVVAHMISEDHGHSPSPSSIGLAAEQRESVTVVFCDVYKFQNWVATLEPTKLVELLDVLFLSFDKCSQQFGCTKIETVFETYLVASGLSLEPRSIQESPSAAAARAIDMALAMLQAVALLHMDSNSDKLQVVVGIHTGRVICGVVGTRKPQYALFGDTVNTASRMKYTGEPGHIHMSSDTYEHIASDSTLTFDRREISVKGKGIMETYLLKSVSGSQYPNFSQTDSEQDLGARARARRQMIAAALGESDKSGSSSNASEALNGNYSARESSRFRNLSFGCMSKCRSSRYSSARFTEQYTQRNQIDDNSQYNEGANESEMDNTLDLETDADYGISSKPMGWIFLKFTDKLLEDKYRLNFYSDRANIYTIEQTLIIFIVTFVIQTITSMGLPRIFLDPTGAKHNLFVNYLSYWSVRSGYTIGAFILWFYFHHHSSTRSVASKWMIFFLSPLFVSAACIFSLSNSWAIAKDPLEDSQNLWLSCDSIEFYFYVCLLHHNTGMLFQTCLLVDLLLITISISFISSSVVKTAVTSVTIFNIPCFIMFNLISAHCKETIDRRTFYANERAKAIEAKASQLLKDMLPKNVLEEFQMDRLRLAYRHENMSFLFADIVGFTTWAKSVDASEVLNMLQNLFARFDRNSTKFGLYKLCTIGDAYVAVSEPTTDGSLNAIDGTQGVLLMAHSMLASIQEIRERLGIPGLNMRIGLHFGSAVGGVIGSGRLRYDLWGMDILTANMMESNGLPGRINVSERFKDIVSTNSPNRFTFEFNKQVQVIDRVVNSFILGANF